MSAMLTTPNRLEQHWEEAKLFLRQEWPRLSEVDLEEIQGQYDRLIGKIRGLYCGNIEIIQEAVIKDKLQHFLNKIPF